MSVALYTSLIWQLPRFYHKSGYHEPKKMCRVMFEDTMGADLQKIYNQGAYGTLRFFAKITLCIVVFTEKANPL